MKNRTTSFHFSSVHPDDTLEAIDCLSNSSSFGLDGIDSYKVKLIKYELTQAITHIMNLSLENREFPEK